MTPRRAWLARWVPDREQLLANRWLAPLAGRLGDPALWSARRRPVSRGIAAGLFSAFALPLGQIPLAVVIAIPLKANILVAVTATLITNPITFPFIYLLAHRLGSMALTAVGSGGDDMNRYALSGLFAPLVTGLMLLGVFAAAVGFAGCRLFWRYRVRSQRRRRAKTRLERLRVCSPAEAGVDVSHPYRCGSIEPTG